MDSATLEQQLALIEAFLKNPIPQSSDNPSTSDDLTQRCRDLQDENSSLVHHCQRLSRENRGLLAIVDENSVLRNTMNLLSHEVQSLKRELLDKRNVSTFTERPSVQHPNSLLYSNEINQLNIDLNNARDTIKVLEEKNMELQNQTVNLSQQLTTFKNQTKENSTALVSDTFGMNDVVRKRFVALRKSKDDEIAILKKELARYTNM
ncbi:hypothetical protein RCL1_003694 [Eukaryota sp. TZLM3-RCL]